MKQSKPITTVCVECDDRDAINEFATKLDLSQRQMVTRMVETYRLSLNKEHMSSDADPPENLSELVEGLKKALKRDEHIIAFIREQEKVLLKPILNTVLSTDANIQQLISILSNLE